LTAINPRKHRQGVPWYFELWHQEAGEFEVNSPLA